MTFPDSAGVFGCAKKLTVMLPPGQFTELGAKLAVTPGGTPVAWTDTLPVNPPTHAIVAVALAVAPAWTLTDAGAVIVKSGLATTVTVIVVLAVEALVVPVPVLEPVMVTVAAPTVALPAAVRVRVLPADPVTMEGLKLAVTPAGRPLALRVTAPLNPLIAEMVTLVVADCPCRTETPVEATLKLGAVLAGTGGKAFWTNMVKYEGQKVPALGELATAALTVLLARELLCVGLQFGSPTVEVTPLNTLPG